MRNNYFQKHFYFDLLMSDIIFIITLERFFFFCKYLPNVCLTERQLDSHICFCVIVWVVVYKENLTTHCYAV